MKSTSCCSGLWGGAHDSPLLRDYPIRPAEAATHTSDFATDRALGQLTGSGNAVTCLLGCGTTLESRPPDESARLIVSVAASLREEIDLQRTLSQAERRLLKARWGACDARRILEELKQLFSLHRLSIDRCLEIVPPDSESRFVSDSRLLMRVLVNMVLVDDDEMALELSKRILHRLGYEVEAFQDPRAALDAFESAPQRFDLVMTDQRMLQMSGLLVAQRVRLIRPDVPLLLCTGLDESAIGDDAARAGVSMVVPKPSSSEQLRNVLRQVQDPTAARRG